MCCYVRKYNSWRFSLPLSGAHVTDYCRRDEMMMSHDSPRLCIRSSMGFLESFPQCFRQWRLQHVKRHLPLTAAHTQPNEAEHPCCNCHLLWSHTTLPEQRFKVAGTMTLTLLGFSLWPCTWLWVLSCLTEWGWYHVFLWCQNTCSPVSQCRIKYPHEADKPCRQILRQWTRSVHIMAEKEN